MIRWKILWLWLWEKSEWSLILKRQISFERNWVVRSVQSEKGSDTDTTIQIQRYSLKISIVTLPKSCCSSVDCVSYNTWHQFIFNANYFAKYQPNHSLFKPQYYWWLSQIIALFVKPVNIVSTEKQQPIIKAKILCLKEHEAN